jgi:hypothetical protein
LKRDEGPEFVFQSNFAKKAHCPPSAGADQ